MVRTAIFPGRYVQGRGALRQASEFVRPLGGSAILLYDQRVREFTEGPLRSGLEAAGLKFASTCFNGECSWQEVDRVAAETERAGADVVIGAGGGKTIDTAKAAAHKTGRRVVVVPTTASTDAPTSALSVIYTNEGAFQEYFFLPRNPDIVLMDLSVIANAPVRSFVSGMGDALATWFEADACSRRDALCMAGGRQTSAGLALARLCFDTLMEYGTSALLAVNGKAVTPAMEKVVEANTLLSGIGFESGGLAAAHSVHNGLTELAETHEYLHGEKVAFGTLTQLVLENRSTEEIDGVLSFMCAVGLPATLERIGLGSASREQLMRAAEAATKVGETIHNEPFTVTADDVVDAMIAADSIARSFEGG